MMTTRLLSLLTSRTLKGPELNYHTTEKELLGIVHCLNKFKTYLLENHFTVVTDNTPLTFLKKCHLTSSRMMRWILVIQEYDFDIIHCKGKDNIVADTLSRNPEDINDNRGPVYEELEINDINLNISKDCINKLRQINKIQKEDNKCRDIIKNVTENDNRKFKDKYLYYNEILYTKERGRWKIYIPSSLS